MKADIFIHAVQPMAQVIYIIDLDLGAKTITNDAEAVVKHVLNDFPRFRIVYRDTEGNWNELCHNNGKFTYFGTWDEPIPEGMEV
jgi:hypothetical protein